MNFFGPQPNLTTAYAQDGSGNEYFGWAPRGADASRPRWQIIQKLNTGGLSSTTAWILLFPQDATGNGSDAPAFVWNNATTGAYTYSCLGSPD